MSIFNRIYNIFRSNIATSHRTDDETVFGNPDRFTDKNFYNHDDSSGGQNADADLAEYYANLEMPFNAGLAEVTASWKRLLRKYHPDLHSKDPEKQAIATQLVQGLNKAYAEIKKSKQSGNQ